MKADLKQRWVDALRSGQYQQGFGRLHKQLSNKSYFCCLGVLCEVAIKEGSISWYPANSTHISKDCGDLLDSDIQSTLIDMNDKYRRTFLEIADYIEKEIPSE